MFQSFSEKKCIYYDDEKMKVEKNQI